MMKIRRTKLLRLIGKKMITLPWGVYAAPKAIVRDEDVLHEFIHIVQYRELLVASLVLTIPMAFVSVWWAPLLSLVAFYLWYAAEWFIRQLIYTVGWLLKYHRTGERKGYDMNFAYRSICFEREAFAHDHDPDYLDKRPLLNMIEYL